MVTPDPARRLILILGDQLTPRLSSFDGADPARDVVLMTEVTAETTYADHHKQKLALVFAAMRHFAGELRAAGWTVAIRPRRPAATKPYAASAAYVNRMSITVAAASSIPRPEACPWNAV